MIVLQFWTFIFNALPLSYGSSCDPNTVAQLYTGLHGAWNLAPQMPAMVMMSLWSSHCVLTVRLCTSAVTIRGDPGHEVPTSWSPQTPFSTLYLSSLCCGLTLIRTPCTVHPPLGCWTSTACWLGSKKTIFFPLAVSLWRLGNACEAFMLIGFKERHHRYIASSKIWPPPCSRKLTLL